MDRFPGDPERSNQLYRDNPLTWEEIGLTAWCGEDRAEPMRWRVQHDRAPQQNSRPAEPVDEFVQVNTLLQIGGLDTSQLIRQIGNRSPNVSAQHAVLAQQPLTFKFDQVQPRSLKSHTVAA